MKYDEVNRTFDCVPTLTDTQVLQFCRDGYLQLHGGVPDEINQRAYDYLNGDVPIFPTTTSTAMCPYFRVSCPMG